jgi:hypothetical protein
MFGRLLVPQASIILAQELSKVNIESLHNVLKRVVCVNEEKTVVVLLRWIGLH